MKRTGSKIKIIAKSAKANTEYNAELQVRTSSLEEYINTEKQVKPGQKIKINVPGHGIEGSNNAVLTIRRTKAFNFGQRLYRLIRYHRERYQHQHPQHRHGDSDPDHRSADPGDLLGVLLEPVRR